MEKLSQIDLILRIILILSLWLTLIGGLSLVINRLTKDNDTFTKVSAIISLIGFVVVLFTGLLGASLSSLGLFGL